MTDENFYGFIVDFWEGNDRSVSSKVYVKVEKFISHNWECNELSSVFPVTEVTSNVITRG